MNYTTKKMRHRPRSVRQGDSRSCCLKKHPSIRQAFNLIFCRLAKWFVIDAFLFEPICAWLARLAACSFTARGELALLFQCVEKNNQQAAIFNSKIDRRRKLCQNSNYEFVIFLHIIYEVATEQSRADDSSSNCTQFLAVLSPLLFVLHSMGTGQGKVRPDNKIRRDKVVDVTTGQ
ncbi:hypothetical protein T12_16170 [Trichinella patagoniensis]|uniref:Uncharacterized protein n=1 Tax=Trichinella patagoniensis TaxID=990121 RepID=A0A0V0ZUE8_9BILA|nr:hypothetical protein T12_16170 [Trichinella patagoniensis]